MAASYEDIKRWFEEAVRAGKYSHLIIVCDTYDYDDYPVEVEKGIDPREKAKEFRMSNMQRIEEVYDLSMDMNEQLEQHRAWNW